MNREDLISKIANSNSFHSLISEHQISAILAHLKWATVHGCFYTDYITKKIREIDIVARKTWHKGKDNNEISVDLRLIVEVKTMKGYHLVFSPIVKLTKYERIRLHYDYVGVLDQLKGTDLHKGDLILHTADKLGLGKDTELLQRYEKALYPRGYVLPYDLLIDPYPQIMNVGAFRETNIGGDKELDNSVLWRAIQSLSNIYFSLNYEVFMGLLSDISVSVDYALRNQEDPIEECSAPLRLDTRSKQDTLCSRRSAIWHGQEGTSVLSSKRRLYWRSLAAARVPQRSVASIT